MEENTIKVTVIDREGIPHELEAPTDMNMNIMELVRAYELAPEGTIGICGGMAMCASCQCYIKNQDLPLSEMSEAEEDMLDQAFYVKNNSRLGCQIYLKYELNGLTLELAPDSGVSE